MKKIFFNKGENQEYNRLNMVIEKFYGSINQVATLLNITPTAIYKWEIKGIPRQQMPKLAEIGINPEYIIQAKEPMLLRRYNSVMVVSEPTVEYKTDNILPPIDLNILTVNDMRRLYDELTIMAEKIKKFLDSIDENL